jgi:hypothetical protein
MSLQSPYHIACTVEDYLRGCDAVPLWIVLLINNGWESLSQPTSQRPHLIIAYKKLYGTSIVRKQN